MLISGPVLDVEHVVGKNDERSWDFFQVFVLDGREVYSCMVGREFGPDLPIKGEQLLARVAVGTRRGRSGGYEPTVTLIRREDPDVLYGEAGEPVSALRAA